MKAVAASTTVTLETTEAGSVLGNTPPVCYGIHCQGTPDITLGEGSHLPESCTIDSNCPEYYNCLSGAVAAHPKTCIYNQDYYCQTTGSIDGKVCSILDLFNRVEVVGKCKKPTSASTTLVCAPNHCHTNADCLHDSNLKC